MFPIAFVLIIVPEKSAFVLFPSLQEPPTFSLVPELLGPGTRQVVEPTLRHDTVFNLLMFLAQHGALNVNISSTQTLGKDLVIRADRSRANVVSLKNNDVVMTTEATSLKLQKTVTLDRNATETAKIEEVEEETEPASEPLLPFTTTSTVTTTNVGSSLGPRPRNGTANLTEFQGERSTVGTTLTTSVSFSTEDPEEKEEDEGEEEEEEAEEEGDLNPSESATPMNETEEEADGTNLEQNFEHTTEKPEVGEVRSLTVGEAEESDEDKEKPGETPFVSLSFGRLECILMEGRCVRSCSDTDDIIPGVACGSDTEGHDLLGANCFDVFTL
ncbi:hypothetical protein C0Q70_03688 [Pomacea canaliculata]|uniref:Uncharacterized protein n=1 Tax=Pomacea canaliculata TaxID=400727 RepID=A0A2T7PTF1_POMCA|nr:hypothetical protein C0Q70_03688 [Pomacea canaliculata]